MVQKNFYMGVQRGIGSETLGWSGGDTSGTSPIVEGTASNSTSSDIELNVQITNNVTATNVTKQDVVLALKLFIAEIESNGKISGNGSTYLPGG